MEKRRNKVFLSLVLTGTMILTGLVVYSSLSFNNYKEGVKKENAVSIKAEELFEVELNESIEIAAPNEKATLFVVNTKLSHGNTEQVFSVKKYTDESPVEVYSVESDEVNFVSVPLNTFSPDNRFIFLKEDNENKPKYLVMRTDGKNLKGDLKYVELTSLFYEKHPDFVISDVTGWGGYTQLVLNTDSKEGKTGPTWWFDAASLTFYKLTTRFN